MYLMSHIQATLILIKSCSFFNEDYELILRTSLINLYIYRYIVICLRNVVTRAMDIKCHLREPYWYLKYTYNSLLFTQYITGLRYVTATLEIRNRLFRNSPDYSLHWRNVNGIQMVIRKSISEAPTTIIVSYFFVVDRSVIRWMFCRILIEEFGILTSRTKLRTFWIL